MLVEHFLTERAIEPLDVLIGLPWLDVLDRYATGLGPLGKHLAEKLRAVVRAQHLRNPWSRLICSKMRTSRAEVIEVSTSQRFAVEVDRPHRVRSRGTYSTRSRLGSRRGRLGSPVRSHNRYCRMPSRKAAVYN